MTVVKMVAAVVWNLKQELLIWMNSRLCLEH